MSKITGWRAERFAANPLITAEMLGFDGDNICGPSLIRAPNSVARQLGTYLLYFAHHEGSYIRLAWADALEGPWQIVPQGVLRTKDLPWKPDHVASPDVHVWGEEIVLFFHSPTEPMIASTDPEYHEKADTILQKTFVARSKDGLNFWVDTQPLGNSYFRVWRWRQVLYALPREADPLYISKTGEVHDFTAVTGPVAELGGDLSIRHVALLEEDGVIWLFYTRIGDAPERILASSFVMDEDPHRWKFSKPIEILRPEEEWEGAHLPLQASRFGRAPAHENALRDPCIFREEGKICLFYCGDAEGAIGGAWLVPK